MKTFTTLATSLTLAILTAQGSAQTTTTSTSSFDFESAISAADTSSTTFDLFTTNGSLGPGVLDTSSRAGLFTSATPVAGPIGNGTLANGTTAGNVTMTMSGSGATRTMGGGSGATGGSGSGSGSGSGGSGSSNSASAGPSQTGNVAPRVGGMWIEGAGLLGAVGVVMVAL